MKAVLFDLDEILLDRTQSLKDFVRWQTQGMLKSSINNDEEFGYHFIELVAQGNIWKDQVYQQLFHGFNIRGSGWI